MIDFFLEILSQVHTIIQVRHFFLVSIEHLRFNAVAATDDTLSSL